MAIYVGESIKILEIAEDMVTLHKFSHLFVYMRVFEIYAFK
jgi:hypothetical protein